MKNIKKMLAIALLVFAMVNDCLVKAQGVVVPMSPTVSPINQSQFNSQSGGSWSFNWYIDGSIIFATNNTPSYTTASSQEFATSTAIWNMAITFNNSGQSGVASTTANTDYLSPLFDWSINSSVSSQSAIMSLILETTCNANNGESSMISGITINGGDPVSGMLLANGGDSFSGLEINNATPITSIDYTLTVTTPSTWELENSGNPALFSTVAIPGIELAPEPSAIALLMFSVVLLISIARFRKKSRLT